MSRLVDNLKDSNGFFFLRIQTVFLILCKSSNVIKILNCGCEKWSRCNMVTTIVIIGNKHPYSISSKKKHPYLLHSVLLSLYYTTFNHLKLHCFIYSIFGKCEFTIWINFLWLASINVKDIRLLSFLSFDRGPLYYKVWILWPSCYNF